MSTDLSANGLRASDAALANVNYDLYFKSASEESFEKTVAALKAKGFHVHVAESKEAALKALIDIMPKNSTVSSGHSTTLEEIGYTDYMKANAGDYNNLKAAAVAAMMAGDWATYGAKTAEGYLADYFITSCSALTEAGEFLTADASGSRLGGVVTAKNCVFVTGSNKIVPTWADAEKRLNDFCFAVESARVRVVYKAPSSTIANVVAVKGGNPFAPAQRIHVVLIKGTFGF